MGVKQDLVLLLCLNNIIFWYFSSCLICPIVCDVDVWSNELGELRYYNFLLFSTSLPIIFPEGILEVFYLYR